MDKRHKLKFLKFRWAKLSFAQKTLMPFPLFAGAAAATLPATAYAANEGTALACRRHAHWRRCRCRWALPSGVAASASGAAPPGGRPCGGGFARGSSGGRRRASLPCGASARGLPAPPAASLLQASRRPAVADAAPTLPSFGCASRMQIEGSNCCCPFSLLHQRF